MPPTSLQAQAILDNQRWLFHFVRKLVADDFAAEDIVQSTFEQALENTDGKGEHRGWLKSVAFHLAMDFKRRSTRRRKREQFVAVGAEAVRNNPTEVMDLASLVMTSIERLPEAQQQVILMRYMYGMDYSEICKNLGLPKKEAYRLLERGRKQIQDDLQLRHGIDWRTHCAALIGFNSPAPFLSLTKTLAVAAALMIAIGGLWIGINRFFEKPLSIPTEAAGLVLNLPVESPNSDAGALGAALPNALIARKDIPKSAPLFHGGYVQVIDTDGSALPFVEVEAHWDFSSLKVSTDENGLAKVVLPEEVSNFHFTTKNHDRLNPVVKAIASGVGETWTIQLEEGSVNQSFRAVDYQGSPLEGVSLMVFSIDRPTSFFKSGPEGLVNAWLPGPGKYFVRMDGCYAFPDTTIEINAQTTSHVLPIRCAIPATDVNMRAVDANTGMTLSDAVFTGLGHPRNEYGELLDLQMYPLESNNGHINYPGASENPALFQILVTAPGYEPLTAWAFQNPAQEMVLQLEPMLGQPARFQFQDPNRTVQGAEMCKTVRSVSFPEKDRGAHVSPGCAFLALDVDEYGRFTLPQSIEDTRKFNLTVIDDLGQETIWEYVKPETLHPNAVGEIVFAIQPPAHIPWVLTVSNSDGAPMAGESVTTTFWDRSGKRTETTLTDLAGQVHRTVYADEQIDLTVTIGTIRLRGEFQTTGQLERQELSLQLPALDSRLLANVLFADGSNGHYSSRSYRQNPIDLLVKDSVAVELTVTVPGIRRTGLLEITGVPPGNYSTTFTKDQTQFKMEGSLLADVEGTFTFPAMQDFIFQIVNEQGHAITGAWIQAGETFQPGFELVWAGQTDESGMSYFSRALAPETNVMVVSAPGYAAVEVPSPQSQGVTHVTLNHQGRHVLQIDTNPLGLTLSPGKAWILDQWGAPTAPLQGLVYEYAESHRLTVHSAPLESFRLLEIDANGAPTGKGILVPVSGPPVRNDL